MLAQMKQEREREKERDGGNWLNGVCMLVHN